MAYIRKTIDEYLILGDYGQGFEPVNSEPTYTQAKISLKEYRENEPFIPHKIKLQRVKK